MHTASGAPTACSNSVAYVAAILTTLDSIVKVAHLMIPAFFLHLHASLHLMFIYLTDYAQYLKAPKCRYCQVAVMSRLLYCSSDSSSNELFLTHLIALPRNSYSKTIGAASLPKHFVVCNQSECAEKSKLACKDKLACIALRQVGVTLFLCPPKAESS